MGVFVGWVVPCPSCVGSAILSPATLWPAAATGNCSIDLSALHPVSAKTNSIAPINRQVDTVFLLNNVLSRLVSALVTETFASIASHNFET